MHRMNVRSDKKQRILDATMELIAENGLHATPMSLVSKRSGVSAGAIYNYFTGKEALINHLYLELKKEIAAAVMEKIDLRVSYRERFNKIWNNYYNYLISNPLKVSFIEQCSTSPLISEEAQKAAERLISPISNFIVEGMESGYIKKMDFKLVYTFINGIIVNIAKLHLSGILEITQKESDMAAQACWDGLAKK